MPSLEVNSLRKEFQVGSGVEVAVDDIDLSIDKGEFVTIVGPSGCGKTTTLRCIAGLEKPTSGSIQFDGINIEATPPNKRNIAMMFQNIALYPHMKVIDNIAYPLKVRNVQKDERHEKAQEAAEIVQISELLNKYPGELSGGQRQRAALARTVVQDPILFLMDEPLSDLDAKLKVEMRKEIQRIHKRLEKATVYVTHDQEEALTMSDQIVIMNNGNIEQIGSPDELYSRPSNMFVAEFLGNPSINFMDAELLDLDEKTADIQIQDTHLTLEIVRPQTEPTESEITIGFRPETVKLNSGDSIFESEISLIERIGESYLATINGPEGDITAIIPATSPLREETTVGVSFDRSKVHLFDRNTGNHFARGFNIAAE